MANWLVRGRADTTIESVDEEFIKETVSRIKPKKAPGLDAVPSDIVARVAKAFQSDLQEMIRDTLKRGDIWSLVPSPARTQLPPGHSAR